MLLFAALMAAVVNPIVTSPFVYPLPTWSYAIQAAQRQRRPFPRDRSPIGTSPFLGPSSHPLAPFWPCAVQACVYTALALYVFVAGLALCLVVHHERAAPAKWLWVALFFVVGWLYVALHFALQTVAFVKVVTGRLGEWTVTQRSAEGGGEGAAEPPAPAPALPSRAQGLQEPLLP